MPIKNPGIGNQIAETVPTIAIWSDEHELYGCPHCGYSADEVLVRGSQSQARACGSLYCHKTFVTAAPGLELSTVYIQEVKRHPRHGTPKHRLPYRDLTAMSDAELRKELVLTRLELEKQLETQDLLLTENAALKKHHEQSHAELVAAKGEIAALEKQAAQLASEATFRGMTKKMVGKVWGRLNL